MKAVTIKGMSCNHCVTVVKKALGEIEGVKDVKVDLSTGQATFEETRPVDMKVIQEKIKKAGYQIA